MVSFFVLILDYNYVGKSFSFIKLSVRYLCYNYIVIGVIRIEYKD